MSSKNNLKKYIVGLFCFLSLFFISSKVFAASINLASRSLNYHVGDTIKVYVHISSNDSVNAVSGKAIFSKENISISSLSKSSSIISLWPIEPSFSDTTGNISFEGVILNGYTGQDADVITLVFKAKSVGVATVKLSDASILANDGDGTNVLSGDLPSISLNIEKAIEVPKVEKPVVPSCEKVTDKIINTTEEAIKKVEKVEVVNGLPSNSLLLVIMILLIIIIFFLLFIILLILAKIRKYLHKKLLKTEDIVNKEFDNLEKDLNFKIEHSVVGDEKIKEEEKVIENDIEKTKKEILEEISSVDKEL